MEMRKVKQPMAKEKEMFKKRKTQAFGRKNLSLTTSSKNLYWMNSCITRETMNPPSPYTPMFFYPSKLLLSTNLPETPPLNH